MSGAGRAHSQASAPPATRQPWLVGLQAASYPALAQTPNAEGDNATGRPWPVQLILRCPATHSSLEAGLLLRADPATTLSYADRYGTHTVRAIGRTLLLPLVGRLRLLPRHAETWQLDATAGLMLVSSKYQREITYQDLNGGAPSTSGSTTMKYNDLPLVGGLGVTYWLSPRLALTADARLTWSYMATLTVRIFVPDSRYVAPVQPAFSLGMGYAFGR